MMNEEMPAEMQAVKDKWVAGAKGRCGGGSGAVD